MTISMNKMSAVEVLCRHLVAVSALVRETGGDRKEHAVTWTCFVMEAGDRWFLVTAGHCVQDMEDFLTATNYETLEWVLFDGWTNSSRRENSVPFNFADARRDCIDDDELGLDLGLIEIEPLIRRTLMMGGVVALGPQMWRGVPDELGRYLMLGLPTERIQQTHAGPRLVDHKLDPVLLSVEQCDPPDIMRRPGGRFHGRLSDELRFGDGSALHDIQGMSGGPIFGLELRPDGQPAYYLVAIQGSWRPELRIIAASRADLVGASIERALEEGSSFLAKATLALASAVVSRTQRLG